MIQPALRDAAPFAAAGFAASGVMFNGFDSSIGKGIFAAQAACLLALVLAARSPRSDEWRRTWPVLLLLGLAFVWALLVQYRLLPGMSGLIPLAPDMFGPSAAAYLAAVATLLAGYFLGREAAQVRMTLRILLLLLAATLMFALVLVAAGRPEPFDYWRLLRDGRLTGTTGNANVTATVAGICLLLALGQVLEPRTGTGEGQLRVHAAATAGNIALVGLAVVALALTGSRFAALAALLAAVALGHSAIRRSRPVLLTASAVAIVAVALFAWSGATTFRRIGELDVASLGRLRMWSHYLDLAGHSPWTGYGLGSFRTLNAWQLGDVPLTLMLWPVNSPHNVLLALLLEGGIVYLLLISAAAIWIARAVWRHVAAPAAPLPSRTLASAILFILAVAMIDLPLDFPATVMITMLLAGMLWGRASAVQRLALAAPSTSAR